MGTYPDTGLAEARNKRDSERKLLAARDIGEHRKAMHTVTEERAQKASWVKGHADKILIRLENDTFPWLGSRPVADASAKKLLATINRIVDRGAVESASPRTDALTQAYATPRAQRGADSGDDARRRRHTWH